MANLFDVKGGKMFAVLSKIAERMPPEIGDAVIEDSKLVGVMMEAARQYLAEKNPYEMTVEKQLIILLQANREENWGIDDGTIGRLAATAPAWPKGKHAYRSLRIRFGEGSEGVALTFERHVARIKSVFGESGFWRWMHLHALPTRYKGTDRDLKKRFGDNLVERLRLLNGDHTHKAVIEWVIVDLGTHRKRDSITAVRDVKSLADELLVIAWMFPGMICAIDYDKLPGLFAAGYESNAVEYDGGAWQGVVIVSFDRADRQVRVHANDRSHDGSGDSVPVLREFTALGT